MMNFNFNDLSSFWMFGILFMLMLAYIVSSDANSKGENGTMWFFIVLFLPMMGLFFYLIIRATSTGQNRITTSNNNYSNSQGTTPPIVEPVRTRKSTLDYNEEKLKPKKQNMNEIQFCTVCGFQNTSEATYCKSCGTKILFGDN